MRRMLAISLLLLACSARADNPPQPASGCPSPPEAAGSQRFPHSRLGAAAEAAEELAIGYADACCGVRSGRFAGYAEYGHIRDQCMAKLFEGIASNRHVSPDQVRLALARRPLAVDLAVILSFALLYVWAARLSARWAYRRYFDLSTMARAVMILYVSLAASTLGLLLGEEWSLTIESFRLGTGHLSYRVARVPWGHHRLLIFLASLALFWLVVALQQQIARRPAV